MKCRAQPRLTNVIMILGLLSVLYGCASTAPTQDTLIGEGFQASLPKAGARVAVWGNHSGAVTRTLRWLHEHQIFGVDASTVEGKLTDPGFFRRTNREQKAQVLTAARSAGVPLVLFTRVEGNQFGRKFDLVNFAEQPLKIMGVEVRGMKAETGDVVFGGKAWNSKPLVESEDLVQDLTILALQKAWNEPGNVLLEEELVQEDYTTEPARTLSRHSEEFPPREKISQSETDGTLSQENHSDLGVQIASGALSVLYTPVKVVYAGLGGFMGSLAYILTAGNTEVAQSVWDASLEGDYWVTPEHLQGEKAIRFQGQPSRVVSLQPARVEAARAHKLTVGE